MLHCKMAWTVSICICDGLDLPMVVNLLPGGRVILVSFLPGVHDSECGQEVRDQHP